MENAVFNYNAYLHKPFGPVNTAHDFKVEPQCDWHDLHAISVTEVNASRTKQIRGLKYYSYS